MKFLPIPIALIAVIWIWFPSGGETVVEQPGVTKTAHDAGINFLHLLGEEYEAASKMGAKEAFDHIEDRQVSLRQAVLFGPLGKAANNAAYVGDTQEFNQQQFSEAMKQIAVGLKSVR